MQIVAYLYSDPLLDPPPNPEVWGVEVDRVYQDFGQRQQLQQLMADCQTDPPDYLLVRRLDELGNSVGEIDRVLKQLEAFGTEIIATEQNYSTSQLKNVEGTDFRASLVALLQEIQQNQRRRRLRQGHARNRIETLPPPGKACYGYRRGKDRYIIDRSTAPVVKDFFERYLLFGSLRGAVRYLEKKYGKKISATTGRRWLTNPVYRGDLAYQTGEIIPDTHVPILSREEAAQIDRLLRRNSRLPPRTASAPRSLAGLVVCQQCQSHTTITRVTTRGKQQEYLYLRPVSCSQQPKCKAISYPQVLEKTIERICEDLPRAVAQMSGPSVDGIKGNLMAEIAQREAILAQIPPLKDRGILDEETAELRSYKLRTEIAQLWGKIAQLPPANLNAIAQVVSIPQFWFDLSEAERRFYFREFLRQIEIVRDRRDWELKLVFIF
jgi:DNA invertase Pin-like site-specific DNA recombinase